MTNDDFEGRADGWFEHRGTWGEVTVGTVLGNRNHPRQRWEIIDVSMATQVEYGKTLYMRARDQVTGAEFTVTPRPKSVGVIILTRDPRDTETPPPTPPSNADAVWALVEGLGATIMASRDERTGEITCPNYEAGRHHLEDGPYQLLRAEREHLRVAHALTIPDDIGVVDMTVLHGDAHNPGRPAIGKGGFPHRHTPEDMGLLTGRR